MPSQPTRAFISLTASILLGSAMAIHAVEPLDEKGLADIHFPGLPATASGPSVEVGEKARAEAHAQVRKEMITENEQSSIEPRNEGAVLPDTEGAISGIQIRNNDFAGNTLADVTMNLDKADDRSQSQTVEDGVGMNISNRLQQVEMNNLRSTIGATDSRGTIAIEAMSVNANIVIKSR